MEIDNITFFDGEGYESEIIEEEQLKILRHIFVTELIRLRKEIIYLSNKFISGDKVNNVMTRHYINSDKCKIRIVLKHLRRIKNKRLIMAEILCNDNCPNCSNFEKCNKNVYNPTKVIQSMGSDYKTIICFKYSGI